MGKVHKKKIAEYTEVEENKSKEKGAELDGEKDAGSESENEGNKDINDGAIHHDGVIATQNHYKVTLRYKQRTVAMESVIPPMQKKSHKRKCASNKASTKIKSTKPADATDEPDSDDNPSTAQLLPAHPRNSCAFYFFTKEKVSQKVSDKAGVRGNKREKVVAPESSEEEEYEVKKASHH